MHRIFTYATGSAMAALAIFTTDLTAAIVPAAFEANVKVTQGYQSASMTEDAFEDYMAATLSLAEPNGGTWEEIKAKFGL